MSEIEPSQEFEAARIHLRNAIDARLEEVDEIAPGEKSAYSQLRSEQVTPLFENRSSLEGIYDLATILLSRGITDEEAVRNCVIRLGRQDEKLEALLYSDQTNTDPSIAFLTSETDLSGSIPERTASLREMQRLSEVVGIPLQFVVWKG